MHLSNTKLALILFLLSISFPVFFCRHDVVNVSAEVLVGSAQKVESCALNQSSGSTVCYKQIQGSQMAVAAAPVTAPVRPEPTESSGTAFTLANNCSQTIWPAVRPRGGSPNLSTTGFELPRGSSRTVPTPTGWNGVFWGRTGCTFNDSGQGSCASGDTVATLVEVSLDGASGMDSYDVSVVQGFNLPLVVDPVGGSGGCSPTGCTEDLNQICPEELRSDDNRTCLSACTAFHTAEHCCLSRSNNCRPTLYSQFFKNACPLASSYADDDGTSMFTCTAADYVITFCPSTIRSQNTSNGSWTGTGPSASPTSAPLMPSSPGPFPLGLIVGAVLGVIVALVIVITIALCYIRRQRLQRSPGHASNQDIEKFLLQHGSMALKRYKFSEIKKITKSFSDKLGQGGFGSVYKGLLPDGCPVAVKILNETDSNGEEFINEVASISRTSHVNIVNLVGFCYDGDKRALVYEYMPNRSLDKFIGNTGTKNSLCRLDLEKLFNIAVGVAKGLEYLHTGCNTRIVHFDIKPQNILLDEDFCPKISDFGLAKLNKKKQSVLSILGTRGTIGYIAPEMFSRNYGGVSHKSDVYSYGMMVLEMAGARNTEVEAVQSSENYFPDKIYEQTILHVARKLDSFAPEEEEETTKKMFLVGFWCIQTTPSDRPSMSKVVEMLEGSLQSIQIPPKPILFSPTLPAREVSSSFSTFVDTENSAEIYRTH